jgi:hypothetical protein
MIKTQRTEFSVSVLAPSVQGVTIMFSDSETENGCFGRTLLFLPTMKALCHHLLALLCSQQYTLA